MFASVDNASRRDRFHRSAFAIGVVFFLLLGFACIKRHAAPLPRQLIIDVKLAPGATGSSEPLITTGHSGSADFLFIRRTGDNQIVFATDSWGYPGHQSSPVLFETGKVHRLEIESPAVSPPSGTAMQFYGRLRIRCDGILAFDTDSHFYRHSLDQIHFGTNSAGGISTGERLQGEILDPHGNRLATAADYSPTFLSQVRSWIVAKPLQLTSLLAASTLVCLWTGRARRLSSFVAITHFANSHRTFVSIVAASGIVVWIFVTYGTGRLIYPEPFSKFFDYQARSLLQGHLDVPHEAIAGEAFIYDGKFYGYFGPTPALFRIPFAIFDLAFASLSRSLMLVYFVSSLAASYMILCVVFRIARGSDASPTPTTVALFLLNAGLGSTLFFLCGRAFMYHEAIMCGATFALFSIGCALRFFEKPTSRWWIGSALCALGSIQARPPSGLFAFTFLGGIVCALSLRAWRRKGAASPLGTSKIFLLIGVCALGVFSFNAISYAKFRSFEGAPLRLSQPYGPERLANVDGKSFHRVNVPWGFYCYVLHPNCRFERHFPYLFIGSDRPGWDFPKAKIDLPDYMLACPYSMCGLFLLATIGCSIAVCRYATLRLPILVTWAAILPMALALFAAIAIAQRYTADFCPFLIAAAAFGAVGVESTVRPWISLSRGFLGLVTAVAVFVSLALTFDYQGRWGPNMPNEILDRYQAVARRIDRFVGQYIAR